MVFLINSTIGFTGSNLSYFGCYNEMFIGTLTLYIFLCCANLYQVLYKLLRRYKYLEKSFEEELVKVIGLSSFVNCLHMLALESLSLRHQLLDQEMISTCTLGEICLLESVLLFLSVLWPFCWRQDWLLACNKTCAYFPWLYFVSLRHPTTLSDYPSWRSSICLDWYCHHNVSMNGLMGIFTRPDWILEVSDTAGCRGGRGVHIDAGASPSSSFGTGKRWMAASWS